MGEKRGRGVCLSERPTTPTAPLLSIEQQQRSLALDSLRGVTHDDDGDPVQGRGGDKHGTARTLPKDEKCLSNSRSLHHFFCGVIFKCLRARLRARVRMKRKRVSIGMEEKESWYKRKTSRAAVLVCLLILLDDRGGP